jgi:dienelactone hydrolase
MKHSFFLVFLISALIGSCQTKDNTTDFKKMDWLIGTWKGETNGQPFYENWIKLSDTEFDNMNYSICNGDTIRGGHSRIEIVNGKITYTSGSQFWGLKELTDSVIVFENTQYGEKFTFTKTAKGEWRAHLQYPRNQIEYILSKSISISELLATKPSPITGYYEGYIEYSGKKLFTAIHFEYKNGRQTATTSTPASLQLNMPFAEVCYSPPFLKLRLRDGTQILELNAKFEGTTIVGNLAGEIPASLFFKKTALPDKTLNYKIVSLDIQNGKTRLPANLFVPNTGKPAGAVIIVSGTGQHSKEEYNGWADLLASKGVAVLTYDKRNVTSFPNLNIRQASSDIVLPGELESDIETAISLLRSRKDIDPDKIGIIGFSQGAVLAPIVAARNSDVAFMVAVSGNTTTDKEFIITQAINKLKQRNFDEAAISKTREILEQLFNYARDKKDGRSIQQSIDKAYEEGFGRHVLPRQLPNDDEIKHLSTWNSFEHDPAKYWNKLTIPSYVVFGDRDTYIPVSESVRILDSLFKNKPGMVTVKVYTNANHFIKGIPDRNNFDFPKYADGYISDLTEWILKQAR